MVLIETFEAVLPIFDTAFLDCLSTSSVRLSVWVSFRLRESELTAASTYLSHKSIIAREITALHCQKLQIPHHNFYRKKKEMNFGLQNKVFRIHVVLVIKIT